MTGDPRETTRVFGHGEAWQTLEQAWRSGRLHHAWLLTGPPGVGKATLAYHLARMVLGGEDPRGAARRTAAATHPDLLVIARAPDEKRQRQRTEIVLDDVRPISGFLRRTAAEGGWRVVIVDGADHLNRSAANALLKLLEEPPSKALLLLVCSAPGRLLPTIRSRCRSLRLAPLDGPTMHQVLCDLLPTLSADDRRTLVELSGGSPGHALALAAEDGVALSGLVRDALSQSMRRPGLWCYELADTVLRRDSGISTFLGLLSSTISATLRNAVHDGADPRSPFLFSSRSHAAWAETCKDLTRLCHETESLNLDKRQALLAGLNLLSGS